MFAKQGLTTFASQITAPTWIISATRASASFVHCTVVCPPDQGRALVDYIITPCANNQKARSRPARGKTGRCSRWLFDIL